MRDITAEDIIQAARNAKGQRLVAIGGRSHFAVEVRSGRNGDYPVFIPESTGRERKATNLRRLREVSACFNRTRSLKVPDYKDTGSQNLSYILALVKIAAGTPAVPNFFEGQLSPVETYLRRASYFLRLYRLGDRVPECLAYFLAVAVHACDAAREEVERSIEMSGAIAFDDESKRQIAEVKKEFAKLPRANLIGRIRNLDVHGNPIPIADPRFVLSLIVTGTIRPMVMKSSGGVGVTISTAGGKPVIKRTKNQPAKASVSMGDSVSYHLVNGRHRVCDFAAGNEVVDLEKALQENLMALENVRKQL